MVDVSISGTFVIDFVNKAAMRRFVESLNIQEMKVQCRYMWE